MGALDRLSGEDLQKINDSYSNAQDWVTTTKKSYRQTKSATIKNIQNLWAETVNLSLNLKGNAGYKFGPEMKMRLKQCSLKELQAMEIEATQKLADMKGSSQKTQNLWNKTAHSSPHFHGKAYDHPSPVV